MYGLWGYLLKAKALPSINARRVLQGGCCITYSTDYYQRLTLESWFTNLEQTPLSTGLRSPARSTYF